MPGVDRGIAKLHDYFRVNSFPNLRREFEIASACTRAHREAQSKINMDATGASLLPLLPCYFLATLSLSAAYLTSFSHTCA